MQSLLTKPILTMNKKKTSIFIALLLGFTLFSQTNIKGVIKETPSNQPISGANIMVIGKTVGTIADFDGNFTLKVKLNPPFKIEISSLGYETKQVNITQNNQELEVFLKENATMLGEVVVSASRTPERILESPVTVERMDIRAIKSATSPSFYDGLENLKGVDINTSGLTFKSLNTRGFATFSNNRFVQLVDGIDNSSPALNFVLGNLLGLNELDVNTIEILPGASSALYGANAFNGILFMTSKSPFNHSGISTYAKTGITTQKAAGDNNFYDVGIRAAYKFSEKFAAKATFSYMSGTEWYATDYHQYIDNGAGKPDTPTLKLGTAFDQLNVYGDEVTLAGAGTNLNQVAQQLEAKGILPAGASNLVPAVNVSRTGYKEKDLVDYKTKNLKTALSFHYRPFENDLEFIYNARFGQGDAIYQGGSRFMLNNFFIQQHKIEAKNDNFFVRAYMTAENAGDSYDARFAGINLSKINAQQWFGTYAGAYAQGAAKVLGLGGNINSPQVVNQLHQTARNYADANVTLQPGTPEFKKAFEKIKSDPDLTKGAKFQDATKMYHIEGNYNFSHLTKVAEVQVGGSWRKYSLNSAGTIFTDYNGTIDYDEYGIYTQVQKKLLDERLRFTGSLRYDKSKNFQGNFSPRISVSYALGKGKTRNLRASFQTGFRNPTTQDQYIGLDVGQALLIGSAPDNLDRYTKQVPVSATGKLITGKENATITGRMAYENAYTLSSLEKFSKTKNPADLVISDYGLVQPEKVTAYELGYRAIFGKFALDMSGYYNQYQKFIATNTVVAPKYGKANFSDKVTLPGYGTIPVAVAAIANGDYQAFNVYTNSKSKIKSYGITVGLDARVFGGYNFGVNYTWSKFDFKQEEDPDFEAGFNTPEHYVKVTFGNPEVIKNLGFNINYRWKDTYLWESSIADAQMPATTVIDAQINYSIPKWKSIFKVGGTNIGGKEYRSAPGVGNIGSQYFISWVINP